MDILRRRVGSGTLGGVDEEQGIYREEVRAIMIALADLTVDTNEILTIVRGYEEDGDEEEEVDS